MTQPAVSFIAWWTQRPLELGVSPVAAVSPTAFLSASRASATSRPPTDSA